MAASQQLVHCASLPRRHAKSEAALTDRAEARTHQAQQVIPVEKHFELTVQSLVVNAQSHFNYTVGSGLEVGGTVLSGLCCLRLLFPRQRLASSHYLRGEVDAERFHEQALEDKAWQWAASKPGGAYASGLLVHLRERLLVVAVAAPTCSRRVCTDSWYHGSPVVSFTGLWSTRSDGGTTVRVIRPSPQRSS